MNFEEWYECNRPRFYAGHFSTKEVALAAWFGGQENTATPELLEVCEAVDRHFRSQMSIDYSYYSEDEYKLHQLALAAIAKAKAEA